MGVTALLLINLHLSAIGTKQKPRSRRPLTKFQKSDRGSFRSTFLPSIASRPLQSFTKIFRSRTRDTDNGWVARVILNLMRSTSTEDINLVGITRGVIEFIVVGVGALDGQLVIIRIPPFG